MLLKEALAIKRRKLDKAMTAARIEKELGQVRAMLMKGPVTTRQITAATGLTDSVARCRVRAVGGVWTQELRCWVLVEGNQLSRP